LKVKDMIRILQDCDPEADFVVSAPNTAYHPFTHKTFCYDQNTNRKIGCLTEVEGNKPYTAGTIRLECVDPEEVDPYFLDDSYCRTEKNI
jgi:hypothetical protein